MLYLTFIWVVASLRARLLPVVKNERGAAVLEYVLLGVGSAILAGLAYAAFKVAVADAGNDLKSRAGDLK